MQLFLAEIAFKMLLTAGIVVTASVVVERSGPFVGALIAALPTAAGAAYIILALEHPPSFVAVSAIGSIASNAMTGLFALTFAALAQRHGLAASLGGAFLVWFAGNALLRPVEWTPLTSLALNAGVFTFTVLAGRKFRIESASPSVKASRADLAWRAIVVASCVAIVTTLSHQIGSFASGVFAVFPIAMASFFAILFPRVGGPVAASVAAHVQAPLIGLSLGFLAVHFLAETAGVWWSYGAGLLTGIFWNALVWALRKRGMKPTASCRRGRASP